MVDNFGFMQVHNLGWSEVDKWAGQGGSNLGLTRFRKISTYFYF